MDITDTLPKISIIVPVFNAGCETFVRCIKSIINQSYRNLEIIIVDDGSNDGCEKICDDYLKIDNRIIVSHQVNQGVSVARNKGLSMISGEYIGFVDSDDWIEEDMIEYLFSNLIKYDVDISICSFRSFDKNDEILYEAQQTFQLISCVREVIKSFLIRNEYLWNRLYKRYIFDSIVFPLNKTYEDVFATIYIAESVKSIVFLDGIKYNYTSSNKDSITRRESFCSYMALLNTYIERNYYLEKKYPDLSFFNKTKIFSILQNLLHYVSSNNLIDSHLSELLGLFEELKHFTFYDCEQRNEMAAKWPTFIDSCYKMFLRRTNRKLCHM